MLSAGAAARASSDGLQSGRHYRPSQETRLLREALGAHPLLITPGIRVSDKGAAPDDHQRTLTPQAAKAAGADALVVGRPITQALDPETAAVHILNSFS